MRTTRFEKKTISRGARNLIFFFSRDRKLFNVYYCADSLGREGFGKINTKRFAECITKSLKLLNQSCSCVKALRPL